MENRQSLDARAAVIMLVLCIIWGLQQSLLKLAAGDIAPIMMIALRSGISAVLVGLFMLSKRERVNLADSNWRPGVLVGVLFALEFLLVGEGIRHTTASHAVVFLYTAPIFAALGLHWMIPAERLNTVQWLGIACAFGGLALAFLGGDASQAKLGTADNMLLGDIMALLGGMSWAATTVVVRCSGLAKASASQTLMYQLLGAFMLLLLAAFALGQTTIHPTPLMWSSLLFQALVVSFASFLVWFWLLRHYLASQLGVFSFMTPLFGVGFGVWLLQEPLEPRFVGGALLVLVGVMMVSNHAPRSAPQKPRPPTRVI
jgi:drug/metabolite transporter (DMT)-like permease